MPANFPEVWENRVRHLIQEDNSAPWLDGIPELNTQVLEMGSGDASEVNVIHVPTTDFEVECLINNTTYPLAVVSYTDDTAIIQLDKYQPKVVSIPDDQVLGAAYGIIDAATLKSRQSIIDAKYAKAAHSLAPAADGADTFVIEATGATVGIRKKLLWVDLVTARRRRGKRAKNSGWRCVLCPDHVNDLLEDATNKNSEKLADYLSGKVSGMLAGFEMFEFADNPWYDGDNEKKPFGEVVDEETDRQCSFIFHIENIGKKTGMTKQYFAAAATSPTTQANQLGYRHYFIAYPFRVKYAGAIL